MANWPEFSPDELIRRLVARGVDFVIVGGIAMIAHGSARLTQDLDICYAGDDGNLQALGAVLQDLDARLRGIDEEMPFVADARTLRRTQILTLDTSAGPIDLLVDPGGSPGYRQLRDGADRLELFGVWVRVASLEDLAAMKRVASRPKDLIDLEEIETIKRLRRRA